MGSPGEYILAMRLQVITDDITTLAVDAIVNAANQRLLGGGGVDGAIHRAAGPGLLDECRALPEVRPGVRCPTGEARITGAGDLPARWVIHTVGPVWDDLDPAGCDRLLASCYRSSLTLAAERSAASLAFPCISTGVYGFPADRAAQVAIGAVRASKAPLKQVIFCCFSDEDAEIYEDLLARG